MGRPFSGLSISALLLAAIGGLAACGGGGGGSPEASGVIPAATATPCPAGFSGSAGNCSQFQTDNSFTPVATATTAPLPAVGGFGGTIEVPPAGAAGPVQVTVSTSNPGITTLDRRHRAIAFKRADGAQANTPLLYITLSAGASPVTFQGFPGFALTLPASSGSGPFYLAELENARNGSGTWTTIAGPTASSGSSVKMLPSLPSLSIAANESIYFVLYTGAAVPSSSPQSSASPQPPVTASPSASPAVTSSPSSTTTPGATPTPISTSSSSPPPVASPTGSPTLAPTASPTSTASPTPFPTASPSPTPTPGSGSASTPKTLSIHGLPSGTSGTTINFAAGTFSLGVLNSSGAQITGSFANAVTVTSSDTTGVVQLSVNGSAAARSVSVTSGSDLIALIYNGNTIGAVTISASSTAASTASAIFTPTIQPIAYSGPLSASNGTPEIDLYAPSGQGTGSTFDFSVSQPGYTGTYSVSVPSGCSNFANVVSNGGGSYTVNAIASPVAGSCTLTVSGYGTSTVSVKLTYASFGVILQ